MGMKVNEYISLITSPDAVPAKKFSSVDQKGIKEGKALVGMTRDGVMTALGYPAAHKTPSLNAPVWVYWTNRFGTIAVEFGEDGKVVKVKD